MTDSASPLKGTSGSTLDSDVRSTAERLEALKHRLEAEEHGIQAFIVALSALILRVIAPGLGRLEAQTPSAPPAGSDRDGGPLPATSLNPEMSQAGGAGTPKNPTGAPASGGASDRNKTTDSSSDSDASRVYPLARLHQYFERNAGWWTILSATALASIIWIRPYDELDVQWTLVPVGLHLLCIIVLFTRPLRTPSDINTIFRFAWAFVAAASIFGFLFLIVGLENHASSTRVWGIGKIHNGGHSSSYADAITTGRPGGAWPTPSPSPKSGDAGGDPNGTHVANDKMSPDFPPGKEILPHTDVTASPSLSRSSYLLAVVAGCDYNSVPYRNPPPTAAPATTTKGSSAVDVRLGPTRVAQSGMPEGVYCGELPPQWVLVIGGSILDCDFDNTCPKVQPHPDVARLDADYAHRTEESEKAKKHKLEVERALEAQARLLAAGMSAEPTNRDLYRDLGEAKDAVDRADASARIAKEALDAAKKFEGYRLNIEGHPIVGGVVVPVYFIAIALMGALINMGRKLPEFQERVDPWYKDEFDAKLAISGDVQTPISGPYARDMVVFQIIQVLSTPGIAVLAYSWARPDDLATTVILAFAAGFTSEVFLLAIRGVVDRVIGLGPRPPRVRAMLAADAKSDVKTDIPARGTGGTSGAPTSGFKVGDLVTLVQPVGPCMPGAEGRVLSIEPGNELIVQTTKDHTGAPLNYRLQSQSASSFKLVGKPASPSSMSSGPVG